MKKNNAILLFVAIISAVVIVGVTAYASSSEEKRETIVDNQANEIMALTPPTSFPRYQYVAKFACGVVKSQDSQSIIPIGNYKTIINIHNPQGINVSLDKKVVIASQEEPKKPIAPQWGKTYKDLQSDYTFRMDCPDIYKIAGKSYPEFIEGFVVLFPYNPQRQYMQVDVTALYATSSNETSGASSIEVEIIKPKIKYNLSTPYQDNP